MVEELRIAEVFDNRMSDRYILGDDGKTPVPCEDMIEWGNWMNVPGNRTVKQEHINGKFISTVFLALDHSFGSGEPLLPQYSGRGRQQSASFGAKRYRGQHPGPLPQALGRVCSITKLG